MASSAPSTPRRRISSVDVEDNDTLGDMATASSGGNQSRIHSTEIPRTYSGLYGAGAPPMPDIINNSVEKNGGNNNTPSSNAIKSPPRMKPSAALPPDLRARHVESNLLPFELSRNRNTDWIAAGGPTLLVSYISSILIVLLTFLAFVAEPKMAWTLTSVAHGLVSMVYLHWIKGNPADYMDGTQGEMNGMTCWEQIVSKPAIHMHSAISKHKPAHSGLESPSRGLKESVSSAIKKLRSRDVLCVVPTLLANASCHVANYQFEYCVINVGVWAVVMLPKMPFMNGVRILGINRTAGIDDGVYDSFDTEEESSNDSADAIDELKKHR